IAGSGFLLQKLLLSLPHYRLARCTTFRFFVRGSCFALCACPALVFRRDCSYISIHFSLEIAEISLPIAASGKSSGDSKCTQHLPMSSFLPAAANAAFSCAS